MKKISIIKYVIIYSIAVFLLPVIFTGIGANHLLIKYTKLDIIEKNILLTDSVSYMIEKHINYSLSNLGSIKKYIEAKNDIRDRTVNEFIRSGLILENLSSVYILDSGGQLVNYERMSYDKSAGNPHLNPDFKKIIGEKRTYKMIGNETESELIITLPLIIRSRISGYVAGNLKIDRENLFRYNFNLLKNDSEMIISDDDNLIFYNTVKGKISNDFPAFSEGKEFYDDITINKTHYLGFFHIIKPAGWKLVLLVDQNKAYSRFYIFISLIVLVVIAGFAVTIVSIIIGVTLIVKPVSGFVRDTGRIARGRRRIKFMPHKVHEFNILSRNFKKMLQQIRRREIDLKKSEKKYRKLVEDNMDFIFKISEDFKFVFLSHAIETILGCSKNEFLGNIDMYFEVRNKMNINARMITKKLFKDGITPDPFLITATAKNGEKIILEIQETPVIHNGKVSEVQGIARDITTRYHFEQEVIYLKNYLYNIIESLPSAIITIDKNGCIQMFNNSALKMLDKTASEIYNRSLWSVSDRFECYKKYYEEAVEKNKIVEFTEKIKISEDEAGYYNAAFYPLKRQGIKGMVLRIDDVTFIQTAEMQIKQSQKLETIGTMASGLAHDFNNILGSIIGTVTLIDFKTRDSKGISYGELKEELDIITEATSKATGIIRQLMSLSKNQKSAMETVDLANEIRQVIALCKTSFPKNIEFILNIPETPAYIDASLSQISQMILNLLVNAKDSIKGPGWIKILLKEYVPDVFKSDMSHYGEDEHYWLLSISDNGSGIPEEIKNSIFEPFFSTKGRNKGTGLGLTIVSNIVKQHNGLISFESALDKGTTFKIYLHVKKEDVRTVECKKPDFTRASGKRLIMVIDDEKNIRLMTKKILMEIGYDVITVDNWIDAVETFNLRHNDIDAVILDLILPEKSGKEIFMEMQKIDKDLKVILISGAKNDDRIREILDMGAKCFLAKPFSFNDLSITVKKIIDEK